MTTYIIVKDNKIIFADKDRQRLFNTLPFIGYTEKDIQSTEREIENFLYVDSPEWLEWKSEQVRNTRNEYLVQYVDGMVSNPLRWADMSDEDKKIVTDYRHYLLDVPESEGFPKDPVLTFDEFKESHKPEIPDDETKAEEEPLETEEIGEAEE